MGSQKPQAVQTPHKNDTTMTYSPISIAGTPEAKAYMDYDIGIDPGVGRRGALRSQETSQRWDSAFMSGVPPELRERLKASELRSDQAQMTAEEQQAEYVRKMTELEKKRTMLPAIMQTSGSSQGFGTQVATPGPNPWVMGAASIGSALIPKI